jgi:hypothetical protein
MDRLLIPTEIVQPVVVELEPEVIKIKDIKEKICIECHEVKTINDYYVNRLVCRRCCLEKERKYRTEKTYQSLQKNGGSLRVPNKPGNFHDEYQKYYTHEILLSMGWKLNEENNKWWKDGIKTKDGLFINVKKPIKTNYFPPKYYTIDEKNEKVILGLELRSQGMNYFEISKIINVSPPTVTKWLKEYEKK